MTYVILLMYAYSYGLHRNKTHAVTTRTSEN